MQKITIAITLIVLFLYLYVAREVKAIVNPLATPNNKFGIHVIDENDLTDAANLINSNGGEWGYVTIVISENDRNKDKWQRTFDRMRELKLIPIIRLATRPENNGWTKPKTNEIDNWVNFLKSLNWVIKNRYIVLFNEPNHANEWGQEINPGEYANIARMFHDKLKAVSEDFFILPAGFDTSSINSDSTNEVSEYWNQMYQADKNIFTFFDGWTSHSYPNPGFSGKADGQGKISITSYKWETAYLLKLGLPENLPIFITETGWVINSKNSAETIASYYEKAFNETWTDAKIVAITPFVLNYQAPPFDGFSWKKPASLDFYPQYQSVKNIPKIKGEPQQINNYSFSTNSLPTELVSLSEYEILAKYINTGQSIWDDQNGFNLKVKGDFGSDNIFIGRVPYTIPFHQALIKINLKTPKETGDKKIILSLEKNSNPFGGEISRDISIVSPPTLIMNTSLWLGSKKAVNSYSLVLFENDSKKLEINALTAENNVIQIPELRDVIPNKTYTFVLKNPYYLPKYRQKFLGKGLTVIDFGRMAPFDFNNDDKFSLKDILTALIHPVRIFKLLTAKL